MEDERQRNNPAEAERATEPGKKLRKKTGCETKRTVRDARSRDERNEPRGRVFFVDATLLPNSALSRGAMWEHIPGAPGPLRAARKKKVTTMDGIVRMDGIVGHGVVYDADDCWMHGVRTIRGAEKPSEKPRVVRVYDDDGAQGPVVEVVRYPSGHTVSVHAGGE